MHENFTHNRLHTLARRSSHYSTDDWHPIFGPRPTGNLVSIGRVLDWTSTRFTTSENLMRVTKENILYYPLLVGRLLRWLDGGVLA